jgi:energy-coupling factor transporter ATP-binding protein EcfA2
MWFHNKDVNLNKKPHQGIIMQQNSEQILKQLDKFIKEKVQANFTLLQTVFQTKLNKFQKIVNELKIYLAKQQEQLSLPCELWTEFKDQLINIHDWTNSLDNMIADISLSNIIYTWDEQFDSLLTNFPDKIRILIGKTYWEIQAGDNIVVRIRKKFQSFRRLLNTVRTSFRNKIGKLRKKLPVEIPRAERNILLHNLLKNYIQIPISEFIIKEWQRYSQLVAGELFILHIKTEELASSALFREEFNTILENTNQDGIFTKLYDIAEILKNMEETLQTSANYSYQFNQRLSKLCEEINKKFLEVWDQAGTFQLKEKKYSQKQFLLLKKKHEQIIGHYNKCWQIQFLGLKEEWQKDLELSILRLQAAIILFKTSEQLFEAVKNEVIPNFSDIIALITDSIKKFESISSSKLLVQTLTNERRNFLKILQKTKLPNLVDKIDHIQLVDIFENYSIQVSDSIELLLKNHQIFSRRDTKNLPPRSSVKLIPIKELIKKEILNNLLLKHQKSVEQVKSKLENVIRTIAEIDHVVEFNIKTAQNLLLQTNGNGNYKEAKTIVLEGFNRSIDLVKNAANETNDIAKNGSEQLLENTATLEDKVQELISRKNLIDLKSRHSWEKRSEKYKKITGKIFTFIPFIITKILCYASKTIKKIFSFKKQIKTISDPEYIQEKISEYFNETREQISKLPYVYQRLFQFEPLTDERFYTERYQEKEIFRSEFLKWQNGYNSIIALVGEAGSGKTTLLNFINKKLFKSHEVLKVNVQEKIVDEQKLNTFLKKAFKINNVENIEKLEQKIKNEKDVICIFENLQHLFIRTVSGFQVLERFIRFVLATQHKVFWIITCDIYSWRFLNKILKIEKYFQKIIKLNKLSTKELAGTILKRHCISGYNIEIEIPDQFKKDRKSKKMMEKNSYQDLNKEIFWEKLSSIAQGNINIAMIYWLKAIKEFSKDKIILNSDMNYDYSFLNDLSSDELFTLAAIFQHHTLSMQDHANIFRQEQSQSILQLNMMCNKGLIEHTLSGFTIHPYYYRPLVHLLETKNILH